MSTKPTLVIAFIAVTSACAGMTGGSGSSTRRHAPQVCVFEKGESRLVSAEDAPAGERRGGGDSLRLVYAPTPPPYADGAAWFIENAPIVFRGLRLTKYGSPRSIASRELRNVGTYEGVAVAVFAEDPDVARYEVVMIPLAPGCTYQIYNYLVPTTGPARGLE